MSNDSRSNEFVHLHTHSEYSLLDGLGRVKKLVAEAKRLGQPALALTDHGTMHGAIEFFRACKYGDIKPIIGIEAYNTHWGRPMDGRDAQQDRGRYHLLLLAKNMTGYRNLLKIASRSQLDGYYYRPRIDHEFLAAHSEGLISTTGCLGAEVPQLIMQGKEEEAYQRLGWYMETFGKENFFIELQEHNIPELVDVNKVLVPWADKFGIPLVATNDVHYVREEDGGPHDVLLCVQTSSRIHEEKRMRMSDASYFLKSRSQMEDTFRPLVDLPASAFDNTLKIAEMCDVDLEDDQYHLPDLPIPDGFNYESYLRHLTEEGLERLYGERGQSDAVQERKERELRIIHEMGFDVYFLIVADLCDFARSRNIWWNVRGSGAGSLVAYCVGITGLDPLKNALIFERFLNPGRVSMPDFDLDYPDDQREEMIRYTVEKYGDSQVAQIVTFGRMKARAAIRDVGRAKDIPLSDVDRIAKMIPGIPGKPVTIQDVLTEGNEFYNIELADEYRKNKQVRDLLDTSMQLEGVARHSGIHAAAVIVADRELEHYTPLMRGSKTSITSTIAQYEFPILESIGLLKVDFLGLSTLSVMREAGRLINERHGIEYNLSNIPFEDDADEAFALLSSGEVSGVFQVESQGMRRVLTEMRPSTFEHIIAMISLYRPGPIEYIPQFIARMHGKEEVEYKHPALEPILSETYAILVYQEQIIQVLSQLAGYTPGEADLVRRAISKKKASEIERHKQIFIEGCAKNDIPKSAATAIYEDIEFFARYGFNKCLPGDVEVVDAETGRLVRIEDLYTGDAQLSQTVTCDTGSLHLQSGHVSAVMDNGVKPVYRLTTALGRSIEATANHPFYTFDGWRQLDEMEIGDQLAVPALLPVEGRMVLADADRIQLARLLAADEFDELPAEVFELENSQIRILLEEIWQQLGQEFVPGSGIEIPSSRLASQFRHLLLRIGILGKVEQSHPITRLTWVPIATSAHRFKSVSDMGKPASPGWSTTASALERTSLISRRIDSAAVTPSEHIYWDKVVSIEYVGEKQTYDLEVPGTHNFIANDILVHNSHAADYAVITVQTAYLKAHYPVEYMAALLLIERDKTEKVINFINECRRMGIDVLPPDVNYSGLDFDIQERPADTESLAHRDPHIGYPFPVPEGSAIRFGMAAIKNVGEGPVSVIIAAREEGGPFTSLEDFADRVDLRQVNKRALECLFKAGAFDRFGKRSQLLAVIDQMVGHSAGIHSSRESGQLSMFDALGDDAAIKAMPINLPDIEEASGRERLQWEKELLGVYTISHPLQQVSIDLNGIVTCSCNDLDERYDGKNVMLAGMIAEARTITTKKGDPMAFVKLEDTQGQCEVVVFPSTYEEFKDKLVQDNVVLVKGKAQSRNGQTSLLADSIQSYVEQAVAGGEAPSPFQKTLLDVGPTINGMAAVYEVSPDYGLDDEDDEVEETADDEVKSENRPSKLAKSSNGSTMNDFLPDDETMPPMEESPFRNDVPEWIEAAPVGVQPVAEDAGTGKRVIKESSQGMADKPPETELTISESASSQALAEQESRLEPVVRPLVDVAQSGDGPSVEPGAQEAELKAPIEEQPSEAIENGHVEGNGSSNGNGKARTANNGTQLLTITFRRSGDLDRDKFRLKELFERIRDPRGRDQFAIRLESKGESLKLIFPDDPCTVNERLTSELVKHFRVEVSVEESVVA